jgi:hypothetical protein
VVVSVHPGCRYLRDKFPDLMPWRSVSRMWSMGGEEELVVKKLAVFQEAKFLVKLYDIALIFRKERLDNLPDLLGVIHWAYTDILNNVLSPFDVPLLQLSPLRLPFLLLGRFQRNR